MYKTLRKVALALLLTVSVVGGTVFAAACDDLEGTPGGTSHSHVWSTTGTDNGDGTHKLTCSGSGTCDEGGSKNEAHDTKGTDGACSVCGHKDGEAKHEHKWSATGTDNGDGTHTLTCEGEGECDLGGTKTEGHNDDGEDGGCSKCDYKPDPNGHHHVWSTTGTDNGDGTHELTCEGGDDCDLNNKKNEDHKLDADGKCTVCDYDSNADDGNGEEEEFTWAYWYQDPETYDYIYVDGDLFAIDADGTYTIPAVVKKETVQSPWFGEQDVYYATFTVIELTAYEDGEHTYAITWNADYSTGYSLTYLNSFVDAIGEDKCLVNNDTNGGELVFSLTKGEKAIIVLQNNYWFESAEDDATYDITVTSGAPIAEGSVYMPFQPDTIAGTHTVPEGYTDTEAYFKLPDNNENYNYKVTFADDVTVFVEVYDEDSWSYVFTEINSGYVFKPSAYGTNVYVTASEGSAISFTLAREILDGEADKPIVLATDVAKEYHFTNENSVWFKYTPEESGFYSVELEGTYADFFTSLEHLDHVGDYEHYGDIRNAALFASVYEDGRKEVWLEADTTYYIELFRDYDDVSIKISSEVSEEDGQITKPYVLSELGAQTDYDFSENGYLYFSYTPGEAGTFKVCHNAYTGVYIYLYVDAKYSVPLSEVGYDYAYGKLDDGETLYVLIRLSNPLDDDYEPLSDFVFYLQVQLSAPDNVKVTNNVLSWDAVDGATGYIVYDGDDVLADDIAAGTTTYTLSNLALGNHTLRVVAKGNDTTTCDSANSKNVTYRQTAQLDTPDAESASIVDDVLSWDAVENTDIYRVFYDDQVEYKNGSYSLKVTAGYGMSTGSATTYNLKNLNLDSGVHKIYIVAYPATNSNYTASNVSNPITYEFYEETDFEVGDSIVFNSGDDKKVKLEQGKTYTLIVSGDYADHYRIYEATPKFHGSQHASDIINPDFTSTAVTFTVGNTTVYHIKAYDVKEFNELFQPDPDHEPHTGVTVQIVEGDQSIAAPEAITLDTQFTVTLGANGVKDYYVMAAITGVYELTISGLDGANYTVTVDNGEPVINNSSANTVVTFNLETTEAGVALKHFIHFTSSSSAVTLKATLSYLRPYDLEVTLGDEEVVRGLVASHNEEITNLDGDDIKHVGNLTLNGITSGTDYTLLVINNNKSAEYFLVYDGVSIGSTNYVPAYSAYRIDFKASSATTAKLYAIHSQDLPNVASIQLVEYFENDEPTTAGPVLGESTWLTTGGSESAAVELKFSDNFVAGATYTIAITDSEKEGGETLLWVYAIYTLVYGTGKTVEFDYVNSDYSHKEATFVAEDSPVKVYSTNMQGSPNPVNTKFEILSIVEPVDNGLKVGESTTVDITKTDAVEITLTRSLVSGKQYRLVMEYNSTILNGADFKLNGTALTVAVSWTPEMTYVDFTAADGVNVISVVLKADAMGMFGPIDKLENISIQLVEV